MKNRAVSTPTKKSSSTTVNMNVGFAVAEELQPLDAHVATTGKTRSKLIREAMRAAGLFRPPAKKPARRRREPPPCDDDDAPARHKHGAPFRVATADRPQQYVTVRLAQTQEADIFRQHILADPRKRARPLLVREACEAYGLFGPPVPSTPPAAKRPSRATKRS